MVRKLMKGCMNGYEMIAMGMVLDGRNPFYNGRQ